MQIATDLTMDNDFDAVSSDPFQALIADIKNLRLGKVFESYEAAIPIEFDKEAKYMKANYRELCADCARPLNLLEANMEVSDGAVCPRCRSSYSQVELKNHAKTDQFLMRRFQSFGFN